MDTVRPVPPVVTYEIFQRTNGRWIRDGKFIDEYAAIGALKSRRNMSNSKYRLIKITTEVIDSDKVE